MSMTYAEYLRRHGECNAIVGQAASLARLLGMAGDDTGAGAARSIARRWSIKREKLTAAWKAQQS